MSEPDIQKQALERLLEDVLDADGIDPDTLLRFHRDPASMPPEQREAIERRVAESPDVAAQLELLRRVDAGSFELGRGEERTRGRWIGIGIGLAAALAAALLLALSQGRDETQSRDQKAEAQPPSPAEETQTVQVAPVPEPPPSEAPAPAPAPVQLAAAPQYRAPADARFVARLAGTRAAGSTRPLALAPEHVARTRLAQPVLYWALPELPPAGTRAQLELSRSSGEIVGRFELPAPARPGLQRASLAELGPRLEPGDELRWIVSLTLGDDVSESSAWIQRIDAPGVDAGAESSARAGLWYDALDALVREGAPGSVLAEWLAQVDIEARSAGLKLEPGK